MVVPRRRKHQPSSTFFLFLQFQLCDIRIRRPYIHVVVNFLVLAFYICCFVIVNIPVIYVCCFASVMRKQVNYHPLNSIYDHYRGKVHPLFVCQISNGQISSVRSKVIMGPKISKFCHVTQAMPTQRSFYGPHSGGVRHMSVPNLRRIAQFVQKL